MSIGLHPHDNREQADMMGAQASAAIESGVFCRIDIATGNTVSTATGIAGERIVGISAEAAVQAGDLINLHLKGVARVQVGQPLNRNNAAHYLLSANAAGEAVPFVAGTNKLLARWLPDGDTDPLAAGEEITVHLVTETEVGALNTQIATLVGVAGAEGVPVANAIDVVFQVTDADGNNINAITRVLSQVYANNMAVFGAAGNATLNEVGAGVEVSDTAGGVDTLIWVTDANGVGTIRVTDATGVLAGDLRLVSRVIDNNGGGSLASIPCDITLTYA